MDDFWGFETQDDELEGGGIQVTGNYKGKANTIQQVRTNIEKVISILSSIHCLNLHAIYGDYHDEKVDSDHVVIFNDEIQLIAHEIICTNVLNCITIGLNLFTAV